MQETQRSKAHERALDQIEHALERHVSTQLRAMHVFVPEHPVTFVRHSKIGETDIQASTPAIPLRVRDLMAMERIADCEVFVSTPVIIKVPKTMRRAYTLTQQWAVGVAVLLGFLCLWILMRRN